MVKFALLSLVLIFLLVFGIAMLVAPLIVQMKDAVP